MTLFWLSIGVLGFIVWAHHVYTVGLNIDTCAYFAVTSAILQLHRLMSQHLSMRGSACWLDYHRLAEKLS